MRIAVRRTAPLALVASLSVAAVALAASPTKGGKYVGTRDGGTTSISKTISLKVAPNGKSASAVLYCGSGRAPGGAPRFAISKKGYFRAVRKTGTITLWTLKGRFVSKTQAVTTLHAVTTCDGKGGTITLDLK
jgi:hypothetical protein